jgi:hypothetical protein
MASYGVNINIDVTNIDKSKMFKADNGNVYLSATVFIDVDKKDDRGNNGMITQSWKDAPKGQTPILGNVKVFWSDSGQGAKQQQRTQQGHAKPSPMAEPTFDDDIPFAPIGLQYRGILNCM